MSDTPWTPGPWTIGDDGWLETPHPDVPGATALVAQVTGTDIDARLIAAAPEMAALLERWVEATRWYAKVEDGQARGAVASSVFAEDTARLLARIRGA